MHQPNEILRLLGQQLDLDIFPRVRNHGIVIPGDVDGSDYFRAKENENERQGTRRPETRSGTWTPGRQRAASGSGTPCSPAPTVCADLRVIYEKELTTVLQAYPKTQVWRQDEGLWLKTESLLLPNLNQKAVFLIGIPFSRERIPRGWGFWMRIPMIHPIWIGPRHTNMPDGSICAFDTKDATWEVGGSLVELIDLYTLWALRHLHLHVLGFWPGRQVSNYVTERLLELKPYEHCGCGGEKPYYECCHVADLKEDRLSEAMKFYDIGGFHRCPPQGILKCIQEKGHPPMLTEVLPLTPLGRIVSIRRERALGCIM